jgi:hypothetical protein
MFPQSFTLLVLTACLSCTMSCGHSAQSRDRSLVFSGSRDTSGAASPTAADLPPHDESDSLNAITLTDIAQLHYMELRSCYEAQLEDNPQLQGMVEVELTIDSNGHIREGRITNDTIGNPDLQFCIAQRILGWKFPPHADESLTIQFPFEFSPVLVDEPIKEGS